MWGAKGISERYHIVERSDYIERILLETHWRDMSSQLREFERFSRYGPRWKFGQSIYSFTVVSQQSRFDTSRFDTNWSRFETSLKSIRFYSTFRGKGRRGSTPPWKFQIWIKSRYKSRILLTKMHSCQWKLQFSSIVDHRLCTVVILCNFELCKGTKSYFSCEKDDQQL